MEQFKTDTDLFSNTEEGMDEELKKFKRIYHVDPYRASRMITGVANDFMVDWSDIPV